ncbi:hypothetical protein GIB67_026134, partial [Kingdonia uniflora]
PPTKDCLPQTRDSFLSSRVTNTTHVPNLVQFNPVQSTTSASPTSHVIQHLRMRPFGESAGEPIEQITPLAVATNHRTTQQWIKETRRHCPTVPFTYIRVWGIQMFDPYMGDDGPIRRIMFVC